MLIFYKERVHSTDMRRNKAEKYLQFLWIMKENKIGLNQYMGWGFITFEILFNVAFLENIMYKYILQQEGWGSPVLRLTQLTMTPVVQNQKKFNISVLVKNKKNVILLNCETEKFSTR